MPPPRDQLGFWDDPELALVSPGEPAGTEDQVEHAARVYSFSGNLAFSQGVSQTSQATEILLAAIPGARQIIAACKENDRSGVDFWVETTNARLLAVDMKCRTEDYALRGEDDLALETWSVVEKAKIGWTRDEQKRTDFILFLWKDTGRWCLISFPQLCLVFQDYWEQWRRKYKTRRQHTPDHGSYHSECVFVPRVIVWTAIFQRFGGSAKKPATPQSSSMEEKS